MLVTHSHGHNDGALPIVEYLGHKYELLMRNGKPSCNISGRIAKHDRETLVLEAPYPRTSAEVAARAGIPPQAVTHVLLLTDAVTFAHDRNGTRFRQLAEAIGVSGVGLGNVWTFDPASENATSFGELGEETRRLVGFIENYLGLPVLYLATGPGEGASVVDRELTPAHAVPDKTTTVTIGTADAS